MSVSVKLLVVGPPEAGKTAVSNFLSDISESTSGTYRPTQGVRILEFPVHSLRIGGRNVTAEVELWDCAGSPRFESCWPAFWKDTDGVVVVCDQQQGNYAKQIELWYSQFVQQQGLKDLQAMVIFNRKDSSAGNLRLQLSSRLANVSQFVANLEEDPDSLRTEFNRFLCNVLGVVAEKRDQQELSIMNH
ncbi:intraflagellar transport protein 22 homolog [Corticium candelabrum]|uniref:intraflagellar transport protein 22 homolog n=1 Tax=Corticium candelabrum TaxID=121492 RepID=UPI002E271A8D|nr:intraflagellar transport protein 22 homolog [Corticium candelabrum]